MNRETVNMVRSPISVEGNNGVEHRLEHCRNNGTLEVEHWVEHCSTFRPDFRLSALNIDLHSNVPRMFH